ncbi:MAG: Mth938-like domain-containing protein [Gammaproteobacteria bacterium]|nr:Mth938-like domain-containing protein [Gammaproteobacteria bacterium]
MKFSETFGDNDHHVSGYGPEGVTVLGRRHPYHLIVSKEQIQKWHIDDLSSLNPNTLQAVLDLKPEIVILGTGDKQIFPPMDIMMLFAKQQIGFEVMNTSAACRTYNILLSEDRDVVAALILDNPIIEKPEHA